jgi:hypothetical protein
MPGGPCAGRRAGQRLRNTAGPLPLPPVPPKCVRMPGHLREDAPFVVGMEDAEGIRGRAVPAGSGERSGKRP